MGDCSLCKGALKMISRKFLFVALCLFLLGCGDTEYVVNREYALAFEKVSSEELAAMECGSDNAGRMLLNEESDIMFVCDGESWVVMKGSNGTKGKNGSDGLPGKNGEDGLDGSDGVICTVQNFGADVYVNCGGDTSTIKMDWLVHDGCSATAAGDSIQIVCDQDTVRILKGIKGLDGQNAEMPEALESALERPLCGMAFYDPSREFCAGGVVYAKCKGEPYDVENFVCENDGVVRMKDSEKVLCNGAPFDRATQFCWNDTLVEKCDGRIFDPTRTMCYNNKNYEFVADSRDGQKYPVADYYGQVWMVKNLDYDVPGSVYKKQDSVERHYGRMYTWVQAMGIDTLYSHTVYPDSVNHRGICPEGFHVPLHSELTILVRIFEHFEKMRNFRYYVEYPGIYLWSESDLPKESSGKILDKNFIDYFGFSAIPSGDPAAGPGGWFDLWSSTNQTIAAYYFVIELNGKIRLPTLGKSYPRNLRCVKDGADPNALPAELQYYYEKYVVRQH